MTLALLFALHLAHAQDGDDARARELYDNGATLYDEGRYEDAVAAFEEAYRLSKRPALLFNIANALERLARYDEALDVLSRYRAYAPADERETLDRRITMLERRATEQKAAAAAAPPPPPPAPAAVVVATPTPEPTKTTLFRPLPLAVSGAGLVALGIGAGLGGGAVGAHTEAADGCAPDAGGALRCSSSTAAALDAERGDALAADILMITGALGLGGGIALGLWGEGGPLMLGPGYVAIQGQF